MSDRSFGTGSAGTYSITLPPPGSILASIAYRNRWIVTYGVGVLVPNAGNPIRNVTDGVGEVVVVLVARVVLCGEMSMRAEGAVQQREGSKLGI